MEIGKKFGEDAGNNHKKPTKMGWMLEKSSGSVSYKELCLSSLQKWAGSNLISNEGPLWEGETRH